MVGVMLGVCGGVVLGRILMVFVGMQPMTMRLLSVMSFGFGFVFLMRFVSLPMMVSGGFVMTRGFFVVIVLGHLSLLRH